MHGLFTSYINYYVGFVFIGLRPENVDFTITCFMYTKQTRRY